MKNKSIIILLIFLFLSGCAQKDVEPEAPEKRLPFTIGDQSYSLPLQTEALLSTGWNSEDNLDLVLQPNNVIHHYKLRSGKNLIMVSFYNPSDVEVSLKDAYIVRIETENRYTVWFAGGEEPTDINVFDGINYDTELETIKEQLGDPVLVENNILTTYRYINEDHFFVEALVEKGTGKMLWLNIENYHVPKEKPDQSD